MLIDVIEQDSESALLQMIERNHKQGSLASLVHFKFTLFGAQPNHDQFVLAVKECLIGFKASVYFCADGDVFVVWRGTARNVLKQLLQNVKAAFAQDMTIACDVFPHHYYDLLAHGEELRIICKQKLHAQPGLAPLPPSDADLDAAAIRIARTGHSRPDSGFPQAEGHATDWHSLGQRIEPRLRFSPEQIVTLAQAVEIRKQRKHPEILVVEDQTFSRLLLHSSLREHYTTHSTEQAKEAIQLYAEHAPDIVFLDIELPDGNGHQLAELFKRFDPQTFVVMVTAYNQQDEVMRARNNGARAFVIKPYNKQKIFDCIQLFHRNRRKAS